MEHRDSCLPWAADRVKPGGRAVAVEQQAEQEADA